MRWLVLAPPIIYLGLCVASVAVLFVSSEPLVGIYAIFLAWPWSLLLDVVDLGDNPFLVNIAIIIVAFLLNAIIFYGLSRLLVGLACRAFGRHG